MKLPADVKKEVLAEGRANGFLPPYPNGTKIQFHFKTTLADSKEVIDDTRAMGKPMTLIIGKQFKLEIWELMLHTMIPGQVANFSVPRSYVMCYPMVSKAVRDSLRPHSEEGHSGHHCCGMMQQGIGYLDLDKLLERPQGMNFLFDMLKVEAPGEYVQESWQLTEGEKLASVPIMQSEGNALFAKGEFKAAELKYFEAIARIEQLLLKEHPGSEEAKELDQQKCPLLLNYALCLMKRGEFYEALQHLTTAIVLQPENVKGLFRRGKCHLSVGNYSEANSDFERCVSLDPSLQPAVSHQLKLISNEMKKRDEMDKLKYQRIFKDDG